MLYDLCAGVMILLSAVLLIGALCWAGYGMQLLGELIGRAKGRLFGSVKAIFARCLKSAT